MPPPEIEALRWRAAGLEFCHFPVTFYVLSNAEQPGSPGIDVTVTRRAEKTFRGPKVDPSDLIRVMPAKGAAGSIFLHLLFPGRVFFP